MNRLRVITVREPPVAVGIVRSSYGGSKVTVIVKVAMTPADDGSLVVAADPIATGRASRLAGAAPAELAAPTDFSAFKPGADVLLTGYAHAAAPTSRIEASVSVGAFSRAFSVVSSRPAVRLPLVASAIRAPGSEGTSAPVGPIAEADEQVISDDPDVIALLARMECGPETSAAPEQRTEYFGPDAAIELVGLSPRAGTLRVRLPGCTPRVYVELAGDAYGEQLELACDTLWIDTMEERFVLTWRGAIAVPELDGHELDRLIVWLDSADRSRSFEDVKGSLVRWSFGYAAEVDQLGPEPEGELEELRIIAARAQAFAQAGDVEPSLSREEYSAIEGEIARDRANTRAILERHGWSDEAWLLEERSWLERLANEAAEEGSRP